MNSKLLVLIVTAVLLIRDLLIHALAVRAESNPIPENVKDVYDGETYRRWREYRREKDKTSLISAFITPAVFALLLVTDAYARFASLFGKSILAGVFSVTLLVTLSDLFSLPVTVYDTLVTEQKYGFNRTDKKTLALDTVKSTVISFVLSFALASLLALLHVQMGDSLVFVFAPCLMALVLAITFLFPYLTRIFNKFTPLEDVELKEKLTALLTKHGYRVRAIEVMDASRRSTRSNAYFTGLGKSKTIVLYDTLLTQMTPDELCAVFAHELGHGLHRDTLRNQIFSFINMAAIAVMAWLTVRCPEFYGAFGFDGVNYGFALLLILTVWMPIFSFLFGLVTSWFSRRAEYAADAEAVKEGYGEQLVSALKKLARDNFSDLAPSPVIVKLSYSHPPLSERIRAIEEKR